MTETVLQSSLVRRVTSRKSRAESQSSFKRLENSIAHYKSRSNLSCSPCKTNPYSSSHIVRPEDSRCSLMCSSEVTTRAIVDLPVSAIPREQIETHIISWLSDAFTLVCYDTSTRVIRRQCRMSCLLVDIESGVLCNRQFVEVSEAGTLTARDL